MTDSSPKCKRATETFSHKGETVKMGDEFPIGHPLTLMYGQFFREVPEEYKGNPNLHGSVVGTRHDPDPLTRRDSGDPIDKRNRDMTPEEIDERSVRKAEEKAEANLREIENTFGKDTEPSPELVREDQEEYEAKGGKVNTEGPDMMRPSVPKSRGK